jgi:hypothetical protein
MGPGAMGALIRADMCPPAPVHVLCLLLRLRQGGELSAFCAGYQGAYGIVAEVESHPFDIDAMLFMDWRDDHLDKYPDVKERNSK